MFPASLLGLRTRIFILGCSKQSLVLLGQEAQFRQKLLGQCNLPLHVALSQAL